MDCLVRIAKFVLALAETCIRFIKRHEIVIRAGK